MRRYARSAAVLVVAVATAVAVPGPALAHQSHHAALKGVSAWAFRGADAALDRSGASWFYTWAADSGGLHGHAQFVPMVWGSGSVTRSALTTAKSESHVLLTFNEPDRGDQANMTPKQALALWPRLEHTHMELVSPAVSTGADQPGSWLARFMHGARTHHYRVGPIALHWYGGDFHTAAAVDQLKEYLVAVHRRYHKPIWLTEFALTRFDAQGAHYPSAASQARFVTASTRMLDSLSWLQRYAWFALPTYGSGRSTGLYQPGAHPTPAGRAFARA